MQLKTTRMENANNNIQSIEHKIVTHHIYEYKKGIRSLVLQTLPTKELRKAEKSLKQRNIPYFLQMVSDKKVNLFFGDTNSLKIVRSFNPNSLKDLTDEQDFILGIMLGYDRKQQCERFLSRQSKSNKKKTKTTSLVGL